jgi:hypothetical protein
MSFQRFELNACSICASVMSSLRLPRVQLLHISQRASQTNGAMEDEDGWMERGVFRHGRPGPNHGGRSSQLSRDTSRRKFVPLEGVQPKAA